MRGEQEQKMQFRWTTLVVVVLLILVGGGMAGCPTYNVWSAEMSGRAEMAQAEQNRKIQIEEARANLESQRLNSEAEVVRAEGMAKAIEIENGKLTQRYIQYLWVRNMENNVNEKIYIPTEAQLPILEAQTKSNE
jgi:preprotein translocase subunit SecF